MNLVLQSIFVAFFTGIMAYMVFAIGGAILITVEHFYGLHGLVVFIIFMISAAIGVAYYKSHLKD